MTSLSAMGMPSSGLAWSPGGKGLIGRVGLGERIGGIVTDERRESGRPRVGFDPGRPAWPSRAETSRRASLSANCEMVSWLSMGWAASLDDFRNHEQAVGFGGGVAQRFLVGQGRPGFIGAKDIDQRHGVGGRLDAGDVQLLELFDVAQDVGQLRAEFFLLVGRSGRCAPDGPHI